MPPKKTNKSNTNDTNKVNKTTKTTKNDETTKTTETTEIKENKEKKDKKTKNIIKNDKNIKISDSDIIKENDALIEEELDDNTKYTTMDDNIIYPYKNIVLPAPVIIDAMQLNNKFEHNIKNNLIDTHEGKCFKDFGLITKIHKIVAYTEPIIEPESMTCTPIANVKFVHELCIPVNNKIIVCKITEIVKELIRCENGPILSFISSDRINPNMFYKDSNRNFRTKNKDHPYLEKNLFVKIHVIGSNLSFSKNIIAIGFLHDFATEDEVKLYYKHN